MKATFIVIAAIVLLGAYSSRAQMRRATFGPERQKLSFLVGNFTTKTEIMMGENNAVSNGSMKAHWALDSLFVLISASEETPRMGRFRNFGVLGYDSEKGEYFFSTYNNYGGHPQYTGNFAGDTLVMKTHVETPRGPLDQEVRWYPGGGGVRMEVLSDFGQGYMLMVDQTATPDSSKPEMKPEK